MQMYPGGPEIPAPPETTVEVLRRAKASCTPMRWAQGAASCSKGRTCTALALDTAVFDYRNPGCRLAYHGAYRIFSNAIKTNPLVSNYVSIIAWNDTPGRTIEEVHAAFDQAIALAEEEILAQGACG